MQVEVSWVETRLVWSNLRRHMAAMSRTNCEKHEFSALCVVQRISHPPLVTYGGTHGRR